MYESTYKDASRLADLYKTDLPVLEMDTKEKVERGKLEWYIVKMEEFEVDGRGGCDAFNLRYVESGEEN